MRASPNAWLPQLLALAVATVLTQAAGPERQGTARRAGHTSGVSDLAFSPDGKWLATASADKTVRVWEVATGRESLVFASHTGWVHAVVFSPSGDWIASGGNDGVLRIWDPSSGQELHSIPQKDWIGALAVSPDGQLLATACGFYGGRSSACPNGTVHLWNPATGALVRDLNGPKPGIFQLAFSRDGRLLAAASGGGATLWEVATGHQLSSFTASEVGAYSVCLSPDGTILAAAEAATDEEGRNGGFRVWQLASGKQIGQFRQPLGGKPLAFSPDGRWLASSGVKPYLELWDVKTWSVQRRVARGHYPYGETAFSPDGKFLAVGEANVALLFDATTLRQIRTFGQIQLSGE